MSKSWNALDNSLSPLDPLTPREKDVLRLIVAGLSNSEIGLQLFLSEGTVKWHNKNIFDKLDVRRRSEAIAKTHDLRLLQEIFTPAAATHRSNLPSQPTPFVGREVELDTMLTRLTDPDCRVITLVGMGGIGKTRLAIRAAELAQPRFKQGVYFVPLEPVSAPDQVIGAVAQACLLTVSGAGKPLQQLLDFLEHKKLLLLLDNFEHLLDAQTDLLTILRHAPDVKILTTSRIPLNLQEEWLIPVSGMAFPDRQAIESLDEFDAIRLFKLCATRAGIKLAPESNADIQRICQLTQGMPLAIELAAALLRTFTCREIVQHLSTDVNSIAAHLRNMPERHHSIQRVFEQSWSLLSSDDQRILRALSIFRGGFTSAALRDVTGASLNVLVRLVDFSFVHVTGEGRYDLHPLIQQILYEQLQSAGELENISDAHAAVFARYMQTWLPWLKGGQQLRAFREIQSDRENMWAAWYWVVKNRDYDKIWKMWETIDIFAEFIQGNQMLHLAQSVADFKPPTPPEHPAQSYLILEQITLKDKFEELELIAHQALRFAEHFQDNKAIALAYRAIGYANSLHSGSDRSLHWFQQSLTLFRQLGDEYYVAILLHDISFEYGVLGDIEKSLVCLEERRRICQRMNDRSGLVSCLHEIASHKFAQGDYKTAETYEKEAFKIAQEFSSWRMTIFTHAFLGFFCFMRGDFEQAHSYFTTMHAVANHIGGIFPHVFGMMFGFLANTVGDFVKADPIFIDALAHSTSNPVFKVFADWGHTVTKCGLQQYASAAASLHATLTYALSSNYIMFMSLSLPPAALLLWHHGEKSPAVECLALWFNHPSTQPQWFLNSVLDKDIFERLKSDLGETAYDQAWQAGLERDLKTTSAELVEFFTQTIS